MAGCPMSDVTSGIIEMPAAVPDGGIPLLKAAAERQADLAALLARAGGGGAAAGGGALGDAELVHDVRVGSRRLGEVARLMGAFLDKPTARAVEGSLKNLRRAMGALRDSDVMREHLAHWRMPAAVRTLAKEAGADLESKRGEAAEAALKVVTSASVQGAMVVLARVIEEQSKGEAAIGAEKRVESLVTAGLRKREKQMRRALGKAARKQTPESLHTARVAVKKLRYVSELGHRAGMKMPDGSDAKRQVKMLKKMQELLGDHHDVHVIVQALEARKEAPRERAIAGLEGAFRTWRKGMEQGQARRAAEFFMRSYAWMNRYG